MLNPCGLMMETMGLCCRYTTCTSGGTKFMLLERLTKHPSRSTADHIPKSISCGRCGTVNYHPLLNKYVYIYIRLKAFGGWKFVRGTTQLHVRILGGKGEETTHFHCRKLNKRTFCPTSVTSFFFDYHRGDMFFGMPWGKKHVYLAAPARFKKRCLGAAKASIFHSSATCLLH